MKMRHEWLILLGFLSSACATTPEYTRLPPDSNPNEELSRAMDRLNQDREKQVNVYAPKSFADAQEAITQARKDRDSNASSQTILDDVSKGLMYLGNAEDRAQKTEASLGQVVDARTAAVEAGAMGYAASKDEMSDAEGKIRSFAKDSDRVEGPVAISDSDRTQLLAQFANAQLHAVEERYLAHARGTIDQSRKEGAEKLAPRSLAEARSKYNQTLALIRRNPSDTQAIGQSAGEANQSADRLIRITRLAKTSTSGHPESVASAVVNEQEAANKLREENSALQQQAGAMESQGVLSRTVKDLQSKLSPEDAQVYEDGKQVHIRLKGLTFATGKSDVPSSDYALLGKVGSALKDIQPTEVTIVGRTDSRGSHQANERLAEKRAGSVRDFLTSNQVVDPSRVQTMAAASNKPVASEKTAEGRALNRGVDILVVPGGAAEQAGQTGQVEPNDQGSQGQQESQQPSQMSGQTGNESSQ